MTDRFESPSAAETPFAGLTPELVLDALDSVGLRGDGRMLQLNSYENRVFQVFLEDGQVVVPKFYRPARWTDEQILEEHAFASELAAQEIPVVPPLVLAASDAPGLVPTLRGTPPTLAQVSNDTGPQRFAVAARRAGRAPQLDDLAEFAWIGRFIGRIHQVGARTLFRHRKTLSVDDLGHASRQWIVESHVVPDSLAPAWQDAADRALDAIDAAFEKVGVYNTLRLHGDCHLGNVLWSDAGPHFVDLDDAMNGPAVQDLWMLLSGDPQEAAAQRRALLSGYEDFMAFDDAELALIEPLRTLRMIHHSAWIARRWHDPAFPLAFPWFTGAAYWGQQTQQLQEQLRIMQG
ncbi:MAG TPA: serine/threonine protein kinase [Albitalea sp.]|nr:serine/threonine protein kinase [Albitalea sp.]